MIRHSNHWIQVSKILFFFELFFKLRKIYNFEGKQKKFNLQKNTFFIKNECRFKKYER